MSDFDYSFGLADSQAHRRQADPHSTPNPVDLDSGIQLRGSIDLVERHASGHIRISGFGVECGSACRLWAWLSASPKE
jgi:hypothetical protein